MTSTIRLVRLLPDILALNGSRGNAEVIATRLTWWGFSVEVVDCRLGERLPREADLVVIGHGTSSMAAPAWEALDSLRNELRELHDHGGAFFGCGLGGDLLGQEITFSSGASSRPALGFTDLRVVLGGSRFSGEVTGTDWRGRPFAGYLNDAAERSATSGSPMLTQLSPSLGRWAGGTGEQAEGIASHHLWVSSVSGPILSLNPHIADDVIQAVLHSQGLELPEATAQHAAVDESARKARAAIDSRVAQKR